MIKNKYIDPRFRDTSLCDDEVIVFSTIGKGPKGDKGDKGDAGIDEAAERARKAAEQVRVSSEKMRVNAEQARVTAENTRAQAESSRESAEQARATAETARESAEDARELAETERAAAETQRAAAEQARTTAESARAVAEQARVTAETGRAGAETVRVTAENARVSAEASRSVAEQARVTDESARVQAESARVSAEASRVTAEQARQTNTAAAISNADAAAAAANTATTAAQAATTAAETATGDAEDATAAANNAAATATDAAEHITDGYFPALTSGAALSLTSPTAAESTWARRVTDAVDGVAVVAGILGRTVVWNQLRAPNDGDNAGTVNGITWAKNADGSVTIGGTATANTNINLRSFTAGELPVGHVLLIKGACPDGGSASTYRAGIGGIATDVGSGGIWTNSISSSTAYRLVVKDGVTVPESTIYPQLFDLTQMFGAGNEPSTVAEFEALFPEPYYPYDAGSLLSVNLTGVESADANGNVLQQRTIPATTYFPNGLCSVGTIRDELTADAAIARVGAVDLGTLDWSLHGNGYFYTYLTPKAPGNFNLVCDRYPTTDSTSVSGMADKSIKGNASSDVVYVVDSSYTDAASFKAAMDGVMLYYALATPTATPISPALALTYRVEQGGTEHVTHTDPTAAPTWRTRYPLDLAATVMANIAPVENGTASANYAVGSYLVHDGALCKVTTAIATGEAIIIGTNVTATTVMAELIALTQ